MSCCINRISGRPAAHTAGFTLMEMLVVIIIAGLAIITVTGLILPLSKYFKEQETRAKIEKISKALNAYAVTNYRVPCASIPNANSVTYGFERGSGVAGQNIPTAGCPGVGRDGIIPFKTLDLPENMIVDGWGNFFTYAISPAFSQNPKAGIPANVHPQCRTRDWMLDAGFSDADFKDPGSYNIRNIDPQKARFCCSGALPETNDIIIWSSDDGGVTTYQVLAPRSADPHGYDSPDELMLPADPVTRSIVNPEDSNYLTVPQVPLPDARATAVAYVIVSHGPNGCGAYIPTRNTRPNTWNRCSPLERENVDNNGVFNSLTLRSEAAGNAEFDDVVFWRTQDMIFASEGLSCAVP